MVINFLLQLANLMEVQVILAVILLLSIFTTVCDAFKFNIFSLHSSSAQINSILFNKFRDAHKSMIVHESSNDGNGYDDFFDGNLYASKHYSKFSFTKLSRSLFITTTTIISFLIINIYSGSQLFSSLPVANAKDELPSLEKCFNAIQKELNSDGESLRRIDNDIITEDWNDLKLFTREYDAGFRGGVLKVAWKQLKGMVAVIDICMIMITMEMKMLIMMITIMMVITTSFDDTFMIYGDAAN